MTYRMRASGVIAMVGAAVALTGCAGAFYRDEETLRVAALIPEVEPVPANAPADVKIEAAAVAARATDLRVVYVHGINCHEPGYSDAFQVQLADQLGLTPAAAVAGADPVKVLTVHPGDGPMRFDAEDPRGGEYPEYISVDDLPSRLFLGVRKLGGGLNHIFRDNRNDRMTDAVNADPALARWSELLDSFARCNTNMKRDDVDVRPEDDRPRITVRRFTTNDGGEERSLTFFEVLWTPLTAEVKRQHLWHEHEDRVLDAVGATGRAGLTQLPARAAVNNALKSSVLNSAISDAVVYLGQGERPIQQVVEAAVCLQTLGYEAIDDIQADGLTFLEVCDLAQRVAAPGEVERTFQPVFVTESLGSRILFDVMLSAPQRDADFRDVVESIFQDRPRVYMFANQLPLFDLAFGSELERFTDEDAAAELPPGPLRASVVRDAFAYRADLDGLDARTQERRALRASCGRLINAGGGGRPDAFEPLPSERADPFDVAEDIARYGRLKDCTATLETDRAALAAAASDGATVTVTDAALMARLVRVSVLESYLARVFSRDLSGFQRYVEYRFLDQLFSQSAPVEQTVFVETDDPIRRLRADVQIMPGALKLADWMCWPFTGRDGCWPTAASAAPGAPDEALAQAAWLSQTVAFFAGCYFGDAVSEDDDGACGGRKGGGGVGVVAFSDASDILTYELIYDAAPSAAAASDDKPLVPSLRYANVPVRVANPAIPVRGPYGVFTFPGRAHGQYKFDDMVIATIVCGLSGVEPGEAVNRVGGWRTEQCAR